MTPQSPRQALTTERWRAEDGTLYSARLGLVPVLFSNIRVPFSAFRPASYFAFDGDAPDLPAALDPSRVRGVSLRHEPARRTLPAVLMPGERASAGGEADGSKFRLEINRIKVPRPPGLLLEWWHQKNRVLTLHSGHLAYALAQAPPPGAAA